MAPFSRIAWWLARRNSPMSMRSGQISAQSPHWLQDAMRRVATVPLPSSVPGVIVISTSSAMRPGNFLYERIRPQ